MLCDWQLRARMVAIGDGISEVQWYIVDHQQDDERETGAVMRASIVVIFKCE